MTLSLKISEAKLDDAQHISQLILPLIEVAFKPIVPSFSSESISALIVSPIYSYHIAKVQDSICGVIALRDNKHVYHLFVAENYQGQGVARKLWEYAKLVAEHNGNKGSFTVNSSLNAVKLYQHFGFKKAGEKQEKSGIYFMPMQYLE
jgi:GNAT superfamily N-acetyltransferase